MENPVIKNNIIEYYTANPKVYPTILIPEPYEGYISDLNTHNLSLPDSLRVLDLFPTKNIDLSFNIPYNIEDIIIRNTNIINKNVLDLFPNNSRYRYVNCNLNGVPLYRSIEHLYFKYFQTILPETCKPLKGVVYYRYHDTIINNIKKYLYNIEQKKRFINIIYEELIATLWHPDRIELISKKYNIETIDYVDYL